MPKGTFNIIYSIVRNNRFLIIGKQILHIITIAPINILIRTTVIIKKKLTLNEFRSLKKETLKKSTAPIINEKKAVRFPIFEILVTILYIFSSFYSLDQSIFLDANITIERMINKPTLPTKSA